MSFENAKKYVIEKGFAHKMIHFDISTATVELAAMALDVIPARIAKTLSFKKNEKNAMLIVMAGDMSVDNKKFRKQFNFKARMLSAEEVDEMIGHKIGGVCPFGIKQNIDVYIDMSLKRFETVYPACGDENNVLCLTLNELYNLSNAISWIDIGKQRSKI